MYILRTTTTSPHGKFHRFLFPFSSKFPDLNLAQYVPYIYSCYETRTWHKQWAWITCVGSCRKIEIHSPLSSSKNPHFQNEAKLWKLVLSAWEDTFWYRYVLIQRPGELQKKINHWSALFQKWLFAPCNWHNAWREASVVVHKNVWCGIQYFVFKWQSGQFLTFSLEGYAKTVLS